MSADSYTEVTHRSCCQNIAGSCMGAVIGLLLFVAAFPLLWWNEQRALNRERTLAEGERIVVQADAAAVNAANEGKLVYLTGEAQTKDTLADAAFNISRRAIKLKRTVEMYQWEEEKEERTEKEVGGGSRTVTTYTYERKWSDSLIDSSEFKKPDGHRNPAQKPYESKEFTASKVTLGAYRLSPGLLNLMTQYTTLPVTGEMLRKLPAGSQELTVVDSRFYKGKNPAEPEVGDARIGFTAVEPGPVSIVAGQVKDTFEPFRTSAGTIELLETGTVSAAEIFRRSREENTRLTWILRGVGFVMMLIGILLVLGPGAAVANVIPLVGDIAGFGAFALGLGVSLAGSAITIGVAWVAVRPLFGIPLLVGGAMIFLLALGRRGKGRSGRQ